MRFEQRRDGWYDVREGRREIVGWRGKIERRESRRREERRGKCERETRRVGRRDRRRGKEMRRNGRREKGGWG